ncbi:MAG TPA: hypothetical protein DEB39_03325 [Planctomycetaceae bacterium]|nr:hypothetical protein [Planctomycetaceae bacterium]
MTLLSFVLFPAILIGFSAFLLLRIRLVNGSESAKKAGGARMLRPGMFASIIGALRDGLSGGDRASFSRPIPMSTDPSGRWEMLQNRERGDGHPLSKLPGGVFRLPVRVVRENGKMRESGARCRREKS